MQSSNSYLKTDRPNTGDGWRRVSASTNQDWRVGWWVYSSKSNSNWFDRPIYWKHADFRKFVVFPIIYCQICQDLARSRQIRLDLFEIQQVLLEISLDPAICLPNLADFIHFQHVLAIFFYPDFNRSPIDTNWYPTRPNRIILRVGNGYRFWRPEVVESVLS